MIGIGFWNRQYGYPPSQKVHFCLLRRISLAHSSLRTQDLKNNIIYKHHIFISNKPLVLCLSLLASTPNNLIRPERRLTSEMTDDQRLFPASHLDAILHAIVTIANGAGLWSGTPLLAHRAVRANADYRFVSRPGTPSHPAQPEEFSSSTPSKKSLKTLNQTSCNNRHPRRNPFS
jgi:hypothetical protein